VTPGHIQSDIWKRGQVKHNVELRVTNNFESYCLCLQMNAPVSGRNWVKLEDHEAQLATYLGFRNTSDLRAFAISWPALRADKHLAPAAKNMQKLGPFTILPNIQGLDLPFIYSLF
jgi:hypothetical protein